MKLVDKIAAELDHYAIATQQTRLDELQLGLSLVNILKDYITFEQVRQATRDEIHNA
jgi:uncharacterized protein (DUF433 family)